MIKKGLTPERYLKLREDKSVMSNQAYLLIWQYQYFTLGQPISRHISIYFLDRYRKKSHQDKSLNNCATYLQLQKM